MVSRGLHGRIEMTIPAEELRALRKTKVFLEFLLSPEFGHMTSVSEIREQARSCLRHYPWDHVIIEEWQERIDMWENEIMHNEDEEE